VLLLGFFVWSVSRLFWLLHAGPSNESESGQADRAVVFPARFCVLCSPSFGLFLLWLPFHSYLRTR
jgi:hypothetical protein